MAGFPGGPLDQQRLDSWKEIGAFFGRDERTVKRWERERGLPVHRVPGSGRGRVYAYSHELSEWLRGAGAEALESGTDIAVAVEPEVGAEPDETQRDSTQQDSTQREKSEASGSEERAGGVVSAAAESAASGNHTDAAAPWSGEERRKPSERAYPPSWETGPSSRETSRESWEASREATRESAWADAGRADAGRGDGGIGARMPEAEAVNGRSVRTSDGEGLRLPRLSLVHPAREAKENASGAEARIGNTDDLKNQIGAARAGVNAAASAEAESGKRSELEKRGGERLRLLGVGRLQSWAVAAVAVVAIAGTTAGYVVHREHVARAAAGAGAGTAAGHAEAEDLYLKGVYYWQKRTPQSLQMAVDYYTQAIVHDPSYAPAYAGLAECYDLLREYTSMPDSEAYPRAISAAERAIQLDPNLAQAHSALGFALFWWKRDIPQAVAELKKALELDPRSATAHHWYATALMNMGDMAEAERQIEMAQKLDPGSEAILADKGFILWQSGKREEGKRLLQQLESSNPSYISPHHYLANIAFAEGDGRTYVSEMRANATLRPDAQQVQAAEMAEKAFASGGWHAVLEALYGQQQQRYAAGESGPMEMAVWEARMGHRDQALYYLGLAVKAGDPGLMYLKIDPVWAPYHDTEQYKAALEKAGLA
jgi:tetratricopeptide (TPR) repeat protein